MDNDLIAQEIEKERQQTEQDKTKAVKIENGQVDAAKWAWTLGAFAIDLATGYAIWQILFWWYGVAWVLAGAGGLVYSNYLRERVGNNYDQSKIALNGLAVSWVSIILMAIISGLAYALGIVKNPWIEGFSILAVVGVFFYHVFQSFRYHTKDDGYIERTEEARAQAAHDKRMREIHRAAAVVAAKKREHELISDYKKEHGEAITAALPVGTFASKTEAVELDPKEQAGKDPNPPQNS